MGGIAPLGAILMGKGAKQRKGGDRGAKQNKGGKSA